jgi:very-short-patch-repair endonuclease/gamma-glutamylcyclotransferase (GGCT)/AIG2-like uncharacterized protein YtfP
MASDRDPTWRLRGFARIMRHEPTDAEQRLWSRVRDRRLGGFKFRRQVPIAGYIVDFFCTERRLALELDGGQHAEPENARRDARKEEVLRSRGIRTLRFSDMDVLKDTDVVLSEILRAVDAEPSPLPSPVVPGEGVMASTSARVSGERENSDLLFIYGSLLPGLTPPDMLAVAARLSRAGPATIRGRLYDLGVYPGIVLDDRAGAGAVRGQLVRVPSDDAWRLLDEYESCAHDLFRRVTTRAMFDDGRPADCWVYVYNRDPAGAPLVECGCWLTHLATRNMAPSP